MDRTPKPVFIDLYKHSPYYHHRTIYDDGSMSVTTFTELKHEGQVGGELCLKGQCNHVKWGPQGE